MDAHGHGFAGGIQALLANPLAPPDGDACNIADRQETLRDGMAAGREWPTRMPQWSWKLAPCCLRAVAMFWVIQRIFLFRIPTRTSRYESRNWMERPMKSKVLVTVVLAPVVFTFMLNFLGPQI